MSEPVKPALSAEDVAEWESWLEWDRDKRTASLMHARHEVDAFGYTDNRLLAAKALDGQTFGFRWEDVERCRRAADFNAGLSDPGDDSYEAEEAVAWADLADRIEALLRPRKDET